MSHTTTMVSLWARTQRVSDDTTNLLLDYSSLDERHALERTAREMSSAGHIRRLPFVISMTDGEGRM
jgi:hypothetical protein